MRWLYSIISSMFMVATIKLVPLGSKNIPGSYTVPSLMVYFMDHDHFSFPILYRLCSKFAIPQVATPYFAIIRNIFIIEGHNE